MYIYDSGNASPTKIPSKPKRVSLSLQPFYTEAVGNNHTKSLLLLKRVNDHKLLHLE